MVDLLSNVSPVEYGAVAFAVLYLVLAIRQNAWCWPAALISALLSAALFYDARLLMESGLQLFYAAIAVYGWHQWTRGPRGHGVAIRWWPWRAHCAVIAGILITSALCAWALSATRQVMPFVDSFTTVAAIVTQYMVAKKVLENWLYWFAIDSVSIYLYVSRDLYLYAGLFVVYLVLIVIGFRQWLSDWRRQRAPSK
jgi:nicotinamide mononucleotide transporter